MFCIFSFAHNSFYERRLYSTGSSAWRVVAFEGRRWHGEEFSDVDYFAGCIIPSYVLVLPLISLVLPIILLPVSIDEWRAVSGCLLVHYTVGI
jgi:hypothetical protein